MKLFRRDNLSYNNVATCRHRRAHRRPYRRRRGPANNPQLLTLGTLCYITTTACTRIRHTAADRRVIFSRRGLTNRQCAPTLPPPPPPPLVSCNHLQTASQPCCIDAGGNIFFVNGGDVASSEPHRPWTTTGTATKTSRVDPSSSGSETCRLIQPSCRDATSGNSARHEDGKHRFRGGSDNNRPHTTGSGGESREILRHAGGILRCRSATVSNLRWSHSAKGGKTNDANDKATISPAARGRPTLRAYSAPLFLHSASFPPKRRPSQKGDGVVGRKAATANKSRNNEGWREESASRSGADGAAPCQHRPRGYLHRFMGFEQEKISSPPVTTLTVLGGLREREFPRAAGDTATDGIASQAGQGSRSETGGAARGAGRDETSKRTRRAFSKRAEDLSAGAHTNTDRRFSSRGGARRSVATPGPTPGEVVALHANAFALGLFADGSRLAPVSPPEARQQVPPVWCRGNKGRPRGAKRQRAWGTAGPTPLPSRKTGAGTPGGRIGSRGDGVRVVGREGTERRETGSNCCSVAFLPYSLERPVSPERTGAFSHTCG